MGVDLPEQAEERLMTAVAVSVRPMALNMFLVVFMRGWFGWEWLSAFVFGLPATPDDGEECHQFVEGRDDDQGEEGGDYQTADNDRG